MRIGAGLAAALAAAALAAPAGANHGVPDTTFSGDGKVRDPVPQTVGPVNAAANHVTFQQISFGSFVGTSVVERVVGCTLGRVMRLNPDGSPDTTFSTDGVADMRAATSCLHLAVDGSGRIVAVGLGPNAAGETVIVVKRFAVDGSDDTSFGPGGVRFVQFPDARFAVPRRIVVLPDNRLLIAASVTPNSAQGRFGLARLTKIGTSDATFGTGGFVQTDLPPTDESRDADLADVLVQDDGRIVAAGVRSRTAGSERQDSYALARYTANGALDPTFGGDGVVVHDGPDPLFAGGVVRDAAGRYTLAARGGPGRSQGFAVRFGPTGTPDATFAADGQFEEGANTPGDDGFNEAVYDVQADRVVLVGFTGLSAFTDDAAFLLVRLLPEGGLDTTFDGDGRATTDFVTTSNTESGEDHARTLFIQGRGRLVAGGVARRGSAAFAAYHGNRDAVRPTLRIRVLDRSLRRVRRTRRLRVRAVVREPLAAALRASARVGGRTVQLGRRVSSFSAPTRRTLRLRVSRRALRALAGARRPRVSARARMLDSGRNSGSTRARRTLR